MAGKKMSSDAMRAAMAAFGSDDLRAHADHLWKFLDGLAADDPEGYKKFIEGQMQQRKLQNADNSSASSFEHKFEINCTDQRGSPVRVLLGIDPSIEMPRTESDIALIPMKLGRKQLSNGLLFSACFHHSILERGQVDDGFRNFVIESTLKRIEADAKIEIDRSSINVASLLVNPTPQDQSPSIVNQMLNLPSFESKKANIEACNQANSSPKIEVVKQIPKYKLILQEDNLQERILLEVELAGMQSMASCILDIGPTRVVFDSEEYELQLELQHRVSPESSLARFKKKESRLYLTMPLAK